MFSSSELTKIGVRASRDCEFLSHPQQLIDMLDPIKAGDGFAEIFNLKFSDLNFDFYVEEENGNLHSAGCSFAIEAEHCGHSRTKLSGDHLVQAMKSGQLCPTAAKYVVFHPSSNEVWASDLYDSLLRFREIYDWSRSDSLLKNSLTTEGALYLLEVLYHISGTTKWISEYFDVEQKVLDDHIETVRGMLSSTVREEAFREAFLGEIESGHADALNLSATPPKMVAVYCSKLGFSTFFRRLCELAWSSKGSKVAVMPTAVYLAALGGEFLTEGALQRSTCFEVYSEITPEQLEFMSAVFIQDAKTPSLKDVYEMSKVI